MRQALAAFIILGFMTATNADAGTIDVGPIIEHLGAALPEIRETIRKRDEAPKPGMFTYWDKDKYQADLDKALDLAFEALMPDVYDPTRKSLREFDEAVALGKREISELKVQSLTASSSRAEPSLIDRALRRSRPAGSKEELEARTAELDQEIATTEQARTELINGFREKLSAEYGIVLDPKQAEAALYQINGTAIVEAVLVSKILLGIEERLKEILSLEIEPTVAKKYYGIAALNRLIILRMHERHLASYDQDWFPKLNGMEKDNAAEMAAIRGMQDKSKNDANVAATRANLAVREKISDILTRYRGILAARRATTEKAFADAQEDAEVALQTLKTLETASELGSLYGESSAEFSALMQIKAPDLLPLDDEATLQQFIDISKEMSGS